ncbi:MAG: 3-isopropylmalate dehydratase small subunit [Aigarchaeota archaeon]|nr:3-isopropylmalate dehydratase small subunit [Aigarchaeota archaeon]MDW8092953.1 3-isopropylmalate dehydratase small subunit [Nitrososphaerota archaeon]
MPAPVRRVEGKVAPLDADDVDTDQIIPAQFLKLVERRGLGKYLFYRWRYTDDGRPIPGFVLDSQEFKDASILAAGRNFGIGSSRENAVWALQDFGIKAVLASSFGDIFYVNCSKNGLLCVKLPDEVLKSIRDSAKSGKLTMTIDLEEQTIKYDDKILRFEIEPNIKERLLKGLDDIGLTLSQYGHLIEEHERRAPKFLYPRPRNLITE